MGNSKTQKITCLIMTELNVSDLKQNCEVESLKVELEGILEITYNHFAAKKESNFPIIVSYYFSYPWWKPLINFHCAYQTLERFGTSYSLLYFLKVLPSDL